MAGRNSAAQEHDGARVANVDMLMLVIASVPQPDMLLCDNRFCARKGRHDSGHLRQQNDQVTIWPERFCANTSARSCGVQCQRTKGRAFPNRGGHARQGHMSGRAGRRAKLAAQRCLIWGWKPAD
ncbi:MAG: hypothetical protein ACLVJB_02655 [Christensenellales bacterium]